jgi:hypothetical protein
MFRKTTIYCKDITGSIRVEYANTFLNLLHYAEIVTTTERKTYQLE